MRLFCTGFCAALDACRLIAGITCTKLTTAAALQSFLIRAVTDSTAFRQNALDLTVRPRNNVNADQLANPAGSGRACVRRCLYGTDIAADEHGHITGTDILFADKPNVCSLYHGIGCLHGAYETFGLDHS